jgi:hypothetical protein
MKKNIQIFKKTLAFLLLMVVHFSQAQNVYLNDDKIFYQGPMKDVIHDLLSKVKGWKTPENSSDNVNAIPPNLELNENCLYDTYVSEAFVYAWAAESYYRQGKIEDAQDFGAKIKITLNNIKELCKNKAKTSDCKSVNLIPCGYSPSDSKSNAGSLLPSGNNSPTTGSLMPAQSESNSRVINNDNNTNVKNTKNTNTGNNNRANSNTKVVQANTSESTSGDYGVSSQSQTNSGRSQQSNGRTEQVRGSGDDVFYFANGNKVQGKITKATDGKVSFDVNKGGNIISYSFQRDNVLIVFNNRGNYLTIGGLPLEMEAAQKVIDNFNNSAIRASGYDLLIKAAPLKVIPCRISYESDAIVNYQTSGSGAGSINKNELVGILYQDGRHQFVMEPTEAAQLLTNASNEVEKYSQKQNTPPPVVATPPPPASTSQSNSQVSSYTPPSSALPVAAKPKLSDEEYQAYRTKAMQRVEEFGNYLNIITDKSLEGSEREKAIEQAAKLFLPDATIEVTSKTKAGSRRYKVREYLTRMKLLPYSSAKVEWSEIQYVSELKQATDGNYYGTITGQQTFMGYGGNDGKDVMYSDVTQKNVKVKLQSYQKVIDGQDVNNWEILLGNIGVANK